MQQQTRSQREYLRPRHDRQREQRQCDQQCFHDSPFRGCHPAPPPWTKCISARRLAASVRRASASTFAASYRTRARFASRRADTIASTCVRQRGSALACVSAAASLLASQAVFSSASTADLVSSSSAAACSALAHSSPASTSA